MSFATELNAKTERVVAAYEREVRRDIEDGEGDYGTELNGIGLNNRGGSKAFDEYIEAGKAELRTAFGRIADAPGPEAYREVIDTWESSIQTNLGSPALEGFQDISGYINDNWSGDFAKSLRSDYLNVFTANINRQYTIMCEIGNLLVMAESTADQYQKNILELADMAETAFGNIEENQDREDDIKTVKVLHFIAQTLGQIHPIVGVVAQVESVVFDSAMESMPKPSEVNLNGGAAWSVQMSVVWALNSLHRGVLDAETVIKEQAQALIDGLAGDPRDQWVAKAPMAGYLNPTGFDDDAPKTIDPDDEFHPNGN